MKKAGMLNQVHHVCQVKQFALRERFLIYKITQLNFNSK